MKIVFNREDGLTYIYCWGGGDKATQPTPCFTSWCWERECDFCLVRKLDGDETDMKGKMEIKSGSFLFLSDEEPL